MEHCIDIHPFNCNKINKICHEDINNKICDITSEQKKEIIEILLALRNCKLIQINNKQIFNTELLGSGNFGFIISFGNYILKFEFDENDNEYGIHKKVNSLKNNYFTKLFIKINRHTKHCIPNWNKYPMLNNVNIILSEIGVGNLTEVIKSITLNIIESLYVLFKFYLFNVNYHATYDHYFIHFDIKSNNIISLGQQHNIHNLRLIDFGIGMDSTHFFMTRDETMKKLHKFPGQMKYLFKGIYYEKVGDEMEMRFPSEYLNISPLVDIFTFILVIIETYIKIHHLETEKIMDDLYNNFAHIQNYRYKFDKVVNRYINLAMIIYNFYNRNQNCYSTQWTYEEFKHYISEIQCIHRDVHDKLKHLTLYNHLIELINYILMNDCIIEPNRFVILSKIALNHRYSDFAFNEYTYNSAYKSLSSSTGYEQASL